MTRVRESVIVLVLSTLLAVVCTWPLAARLGSMGRVDTGDGRWSIWVVSWVAHALTTRPTTLFDANIFYPEHGTLAYSEANVGAGILGMPAWLATRNPYAAHNLAVFLSFVLSTIAMYGLARYLTGGQMAAAVAAVLYAYCPFVFARTAHIQLLMIWGLPLVMLCVHRLIDRHSLGRAIALGIVLAAQALSCAYYGILGGLIVGAAVIAFSRTRGLWRDVHWWLHVAVAAATACGLVLPFFIPYIEHQEMTGFARSHADIVRYSADWKAWFASSARAHRWMQPLLGSWKEVLFPGFVATALGLAGIWAGLRRGPRAAAPPSGDAPPGRDVVVFYGLLLVAIVWVSFGPDAGLYAVLAKYVPVFSFLRAPARFGIGAVLALAVLSAVTASWLAARWPRQRLVPAAILLLAIADLFTGPLVQPPAVSMPAAHRVLARMPPGPVVELPFFERRMDYHRHTEYMLYSTAHWRPLVNGYSDYASPIWMQRALVLRQFPAGGAVELSRILGVRYIVLHARLFSRSELAIVRERFAELGPTLKLLVADAGVELYLFEP